ncbi:nucleotidyltransferase [Bacillaceae bacterium SIJ1]|uniref:nucleotidyltransferase n=1 Tax=Litoribacterium kuwaitense TaxID=1398745 RepID=UPI0013EDC31A|nr:nucleotidyltransferase [Litoribacterium kuwaitense]NGP44357.1 nucleotidyltransferase [Litoribacterium kuwaitense]
MKSVGLVVEYNPFHNGHLYHLHESKRASGAEVVVAVMSGSFLQRGEPALLPRWERTQMALAAGVDVVIELPYTFAVQRADLFALGAISILDNIGCDAICFGSESGNLDLFNNAVQTIQFKREEYDALTRQAVAEGISYPAATQRAFQELVSGEQLDLSKPNNSLGFHYVNALYTLKSTMKPLTIARKHADYHDTEMAGSIASATAIREAFFSQGTLSADILQALPPSTATIMNNYIETYSKLHHWEDYFPMLQHQLNTATAARLQEVYEMEEGLEHRFRKYRFTSGSFQALLEAVKTKRYTRTRLQRALTHLLTGALKESMKPIARSPLEHLPQAARLLGFSEIGQKFLREANKNDDFTLQTRWKEAQCHHQVFSEQAAIVHALCLPSPEQTIRIREEINRIPLMKTP